jgi:hypothetical protein
MDTSHFCVNCSMVYHSHDNANLSCQVEADDFLGALWVNQGRGPYQNERYLQTQMAIEIYL